VGSCTFDRTLGGGHALLLNDFAEWYTQLTGTAFIQRTAQGELVKDYYDVLSMPEWLTERAGPVLDLLAVRYLLFTSQAPAWVAENPDRFIQRDAGRLVAYENRHALPAAFVVHQARPVKSVEEAAIVIGQPGFDYRSVAPTPPGFDPVLLAPPQRDETVRVTEYARNRVDLAASLDAPGLIVITDTMYPGWKVSIDGGQPQAPIAAYGILKATLVPAGDHIVRFFFDPPLFRIGFGISMIALVLVQGTVVLLLPRRHGKKNANNGPPKDAIHRYSE
jgi:hypothetical protein